MTFPSVLASALLLGLFAAPQAALAQTSPSSDATLSSLGLKQWVRYDSAARKQVFRTLNLSPAFDPDTLTYTVALPRPAGNRGSSLVVFSATPGDPSVSRMGVRRSPYDTSSLTRFNRKGEAWLGVSNGTSHYRIEVTAQDNSTRRFYSVQVTETTDQVQTNQVPTVSIREAGSQNTSRNTDLSLTAEGSDPDGGSVTYAWTATDSRNNNVTSSVFPNGTNTATTTFRADTAGDYTVTVTVTDDEATTASASLTVSVTTPVSQQQALSSDASLSVLALEYVKSAGVYEYVYLSPAFAPDTTHYTGKLVRPEDSRGLGTVRFTATPTADAVTGMVLRKGTDENNFDAQNRASGNLDNGVNNYEIVVTAENGTNTRTYTVALSEVAAQDPTVTISPTGSTIEPNTVLSLTATASDPDGGGLTYSWSATDSDGNNVTSTVYTSGTNAAKVPFRTATTDTYTVTVTVTDDENATTTVSTTVTVAVDPKTQPPTVTIGHSDSSIVLNDPHIITVNTDLTLTATATATATRTDSKIESYTWSAVEVDEHGTGRRFVTDTVLNRRDSSAVTFNAATAGDYRIGVIVFDDEDNSTTATPLIVRVVPVPASSDTKLSALSVTTGGPHRRKPLILVPPFSPTTYEYSVVEPRWGSNSRPNWVTEHYGIITMLNVGNLNVTATVNDDDAKLSGSFPWIPRGETEPQTELRLTSGVEKGVGPLVRGKENVLTITVTAEDGSSQEYTLKAKRRGTGRTPPTAALDPSGDRTIDAGSDLVLDASGSSDPDGGDLIGHAWYVMGPRGRNATAAVLGNERTGPEVTFNANSAGTYRVWLMVFDDDGHVGYARKTVTVTPSGPLALHVADASIVEPSSGQGRIYFDVTLSERASEVVWVSWTTANGTATAGEDYSARSGSLRFAPGETWKRIGVTVLNDSHDEGEETFFLRLSNPTGAALGDGEATGTITNTDPMPSAWLARFGRTVAEQALDGISSRRKASRTAGFAGSLAGQSLLENGYDAATGHDPAIGYDDAAQSVRSRTMSVGELLRGSSFSLTGSRDANGGSLAFWGRGAETSFDGREGELVLDGKVTTGMLGADYGRGPWTVGVSLVQSEGEGGYAPREPSGQTAGTAGKIETSLTAAVPWASWQISQRLDVWGAAGTGSGDMTLKPEEDSAIKTDLGWSMAAVGVRSELLAPRDGGGGPGLALTADALWASTDSDRVDGLVATDSKVNRLRVGLEGSWALLMDGGARLEPRLEVGARHDGGDAESGSGFDLGGGITWSDPGSGLSLEVEGRTLLSHAEDGVEEQGYAASIAFDPDPKTKRGPSFSLRQDWGIATGGGLDALFSPGPITGHIGTASPSGRWVAEAAYGIPAFDGRYTTSPHVGFSHSDAGHEYSLGWRVAPEGRAAANLTLGLKATRRESAESKPEHWIGFEFTAYW